MNKVGHLKGAAAAGTYLNQLLAAGNSGWYGFLPEHIKLKSWDCLVGYNFQFGHLFSRNGSRKQLMTLH